MNRSNYGESLWWHILRDQLQVAEADDFWTCVHDGVRPDRGLPEPPAQALPADLVHLLISRVGIPEAEVAAMNRQDALARLARYWTEGS